jgi:hypothetical protein
MRKDMRHAQGHVALLNIKHMQAHARAEGLAARPATAASLRENGC